MLVIYQFCQACRPALTSLVVCPKVIHAESACNGKIGISLLTSSQQATNRKHFYKLHQEGEEVKLLTT